MVSLIDLWLPIVLSAAAVLVAANLLWMGLPFWHRRDTRKLPDEAAVLAGLASASSGMYIAPCVDWKKQTPEERAAMQKGPMAMLMMRNPVSEFSFPLALGSYFAYTLVISIFVAYLTCHTLGAGASWRGVLRVAGTGGVLAYTFGGIPYSIWYGKPWTATLKDVIDGLLFGALVGATFAWLWPR